jgi:hypothetical protein
LITFIAVLCETDNLRLSTIVLSCWAIANVQKTDAYILAAAAHALGDLEVVLGLLHYIFQNCENNLENKE